MNHLDELENNSIYIIREAYKQFKNIGVLWSIGKDSTTLVWLCRKAFFGKVPFPAIHIDTTYKFPEMYKFRDFFAKEWELKLMVEKKWLIKINNSYSCQNKAIILVKINLFFKKLYKLSETG